MRLLSRPARLLATRGREFLSSPEITARLRSIVVPVDGSHASLQAVGLACEIARKNKGKVYVVHVIEVKRHLPLDAALEPEAAAGEAILAQAEEIGRAQRFDVEGEILQARQAGHAIVDEAVERAADLIVLGLDYPPPFGQFTLGSVAQYVLRSAPCEVWLTRQTVQE
jgi:nucleotide-binding universal stress UspA family protein